MKQNSIDKLINEALTVEAEEAKSANAIGFMARALVQATLPHSKQRENEFERQNGLFRLNMLAPKKIGLPYGSLPRLLIAWLTTEAVKTQKKEIVLGHTLSEFMAELDLIPTGGRWGSITRLREQMKRLFSSSISCSFDDGKNWVIKNIQPVQEANLWWNPIDPNQATLFQSTITLGEFFFNEAVKNPIPIDMRVLKALKRSPLALDIYCWLTYRMSYLKKQSVILWEALQLQFGADYAQNSQGTRDFKRAFLRELKKVTIFYETKLDQNDIGLILKPNKPHISNYLYK